MSPTLAGVGMREAREREDALRRETVTADAQRRWNAARPADPNHTYLRQKKVPPFDLRQEGEDLLIPVRGTDGVLRGLQRILPTGKKFFIPGTAKQGAFHLIGEPNGVLAIAEGYATAATVRQATGMAVAVAFDAGNLRPVAEELAKQFPRTCIAIAADNDRDGDKNTGLLGATDAAFAVGGEVVFPRFSELQEGTDWNDLAALCGLDAVTDAFRHVHGFESPKDEGVTWRTLAEVDSTPPEELLLGMLEPEGPNLMYAAGGVGKGSTLAYMAGELLKIGMRPLIYDAENRPKEWARRTEGLGINRADVAYLQPKDLTRTLFGEPLWNVVPHLGKVAAAAGANVLLIDSILAGMNIGEEKLKSDAQAPYLVVAALDAIGLPSVCVGHTSRATPDGDPYGSVSWVNAMRLTWIGSPAEGDGHRVRWRPRKRNERGHIPAVLLHFIYDGNVLARVERSDDEENTKDWLRVALRAGPRTVEELADELVQTLEDVTPAAVERAKARLRQTLGRMNRTGLAVKVSEKRNSPWRLT